MTQQNLASMAESNLKSTSTEEMVSFSTLSEMTGFPIDFIKKELLLDEEPISMSKLRETMAVYLDATIEHVRG